MKKNMYLLLVAILFAGAALLFKNQIGTAVWWIFIILGAGALICYLVLKYQYQIAQKKLAKKIAEKQAEDKNNKPKKLNYNQKKDS